jgi:hypothetical protein
MGRILNVISTRAFCEHGLDFRQALSGYTRRSSPLAQIQDQINQQQLPNCNHYEYVGIAKKWLMS